MTGKLTHIEIIRNHLEKYGTITSMEAFELYGITRLAATIFVLRKHFKNSKCGLRIDNETCECINRWGRNVTYVKYRLVKETEDGKEA